MTNVPIVDIEFIGPDRATPQDYADALSEVFGGPGGSTWVRVRTLDRSSYAENGGPLPADLRPVFVTVLLRHRPTGEGLSALAQSIAFCVASISGRMIENIHLEFSPSAVGRVVFGGKLVE